MKYSPEEIYCSTPTVYSDSYEYRKVRSYACPQFVLSDPLSRSSTLCPVRICRPWGCQGAIVRRIQCPLLRVVSDSRIHLMDTASSSKASADSFPTEESVRFRRHQRWLYIRIRHASPSLIEAFYSASDYLSSLLSSRFADAWSGADGWMMGFLVQALSLFFAFLFSFPVSGDGEHARKFGTYCLYVGTGITIFLRIANCFRFYPFSYMGIDYTYLSTLGNID